jgi:hypothetical protein
MTKRVVKMRHGLKLGKRGDGLTQVMKLLGQVLKTLIYVI